MNLRTLAAAAMRVGLRPEEYLRRRETEKWCTKCRAWHPKLAFGPDRSRGDGLRAACRMCRRVIMRTPAQRFLAKSVRHASGCLIWRGSRYASGYGSFWYAGKVRSAHRASWLIFRGEIPPGRYVLHRCDVRLCVRPEHLFLGTHQENMDDMAAKGRRASMRFGANPRAKLRGSDVLQIRRLRGLVSQRDLARAFGVSKTAIYFVQTHRNWREFPAGAAANERTLRAALREAT